MLRETIPAERAADVLAERLREKAGRSGRAVAAIDGRCASGKTTLARRLAELLGAQVVHMDDFFLPKELRTPARLGEPGGNVHYERFAAEVLRGLASGEAFEYGVFDCSQMRVTHTARIDPSGICIVEGSYSTHPVFDEPYDLTMFMSVAPDEQERRIRARGGDGSWESFRDRWIPLEERYFEHCGVRERAGIIIE